MILRLLATMIALVVVCLALLVWQLSRGPVSLDFATPYLEEAVRDEGGEWNLKVGELVLMSDLEIHARNVDLQDNDGTPVLQLPDVVVRPSLRALLQGLVAVRSVEINNPTARILHRPDGSFGVSLAEAQTPEAGGDADAEFLEDLLQPAEPDTALGFLRHFRVNNAKLTVVEVETGHTWAVEEADIDLLRGPEGHELIGKAGLRGEKIDQQAVALDARLDVRPAGDGFVIDGKARATGIEAGRLGLYWPRNAAASARGWVIEHIPRGTVTEAVLNVAFDSPSGTDFRLGKLDGSMRYQGLEVRWDDEAPPVTAVAGTATFDASSMHFKVESGASSSIRLHSGRLELLALDTDNERIAIVVKGEGPVAGVLDLIPGDSVKLPFEASGAAGLDAQIKFPLRASLTFADVTLDVASEPKSVQIRHEVGNGTVSGAVRYEKPPRRDGVLTADLDVTGASVDVGEFSWKQPAGRRGKVEIGMKLGEGPLTLDPLRVEFTEVRAQGSIVIGADGTAGSARLNKVAYGQTNLDRADVDWSAGSLKVRIGDGTLDLSPLSGEAEAQDDGEPLDLDIETGDLRRVTFDADSWVENARGTIVRRNDVWEHIDVRGELPRALWSAGEASAETARKTFSVRLRPTGPGWRLEANTADLGSLLRAIDATDKLHGGLLEVSGRADRMANGVVLRSHVKVTDFKVRDMPLALRLLSAAALTRLLGTIRGEGLHFDALKGTVIVRGDRYQLDNVRAHGSSIGWTAKGWIDTGSDRLQLEGAVIPANQANRVLGRIPFLGSLLTGTDGRGLIAISYTAVGDLRSPQVSTNPLTALTPGFLREVWELGK